MLAGNGSTGYSNGNGNDRLSREIKNFLGRTDTLQDRRQRTGSPPLQQRAASVARDDFDSSFRSTSTAAPPSRNSIHFRASSVAPTLYGVRDGPKYSNGNGNWRELSPPNFSYRRNADSEFSSRDVVSVTRSVTGRAAELPLLSAGLSQRSRFMTLEEECNWILSGREPIPVTSGQDNGADSDGDDDTLDDISGDEVRLVRLVHGVHGLGLHSSTQSRIELVNSTKVAQCKQLNIRSYFDFIWDLNFYDFLILTDKVIN